MAERVAALNKMFTKGSAPEATPAASSSSAPVNEAPKGEMSMKERIAAIERIAAEKKKREMEAAQEEKKGGETTAKPRAVAISFKPSGYVPPAPKAARQIQAPQSANCSVKTFPVSDAKAPWMMELPGI